MEDVHEDRRRLRCRATLAVTLCGVLLGPSTTSAFECIASGYEGTQSYGALSTVNARIVFVYFPPDSTEQTPDSVLVPWADWLATELHDFVDVMSRRPQDLNVRAEPTRI
jgi:hypothetical protein